MYNEEIHYLNFLRKYYYNNKIRKDVLDRVYGMRESDLRIQIF